MNPDFPLWAFTPVWMDANAIDKLHDIDYHTDMDDLGLHSEALAPPLAAELASPSQVAELASVCQTPARQLVWGLYIDELVQQKTYALVSDALVATVHYPLQDQLYRTAALTDSGGCIAEAYDYDAYGNTMIYKAPGTVEETTSWWNYNAVATKMVKCEHLFTGRQYDPESEIYHYRARYYLPKLGRFGQRDPIGYGDGMSLFAYLNNNPINQVDPSGLAGGASNAWDASSQHFFVNHSSVGAVIRNQKASAPTQPEPPCVPRDAKEYYRKLQATTSHFKNYSIPTVLKAKPGTLIETFLKAQLCILDSLVNGACCTDAAGWKWIANLVEDFINPLAESLSEYANNKVITNGPWRKTFSRLNELQFLFEATDVYPGEGPMDFVYKLIAANEMAQTHIFSDLRHSMLENGIGKQKDWACIGRVVNDCAKKHVGNITYSFGQAVLPTKMNPESIRDTVRDQVGEQLDKELDEDFRQFYGY